MGMVYMRRYKLPLIMQSELAECGIACLAMVSSYYGRHYTLSEIRHVSDATLKGINLSKLKEISGSIGLKSVVLRVELSQLSTLTTPCILHWDSNHFVVLKKVTPNYLFLHDPARGAIKISMNEADFSFTGIAVEFSPAENFSIKPRQRNKNIILRSVLGTKKLALGKLLLMSVLIQLVYLLMIKISQAEIDSAGFILNNNSSVIVIIFSMIFLKLIEVSSIAIRSFMLSVVSTKINYEFSLATINHMVRLPLSFFLNRHVGDISSRFGAIEKIRSTITDGFVEGVVDGVIAIFTLLAIFIISLKIALIVILSTALYLLSTAFFENKTKQVQSESLYARSCEFSNFIETIKAITPIKVFSKESFRVDQWKSKFIKSLNSLTKLAWYKTLYDSYKNIVFGFEFILVLLIGCRLMLNKEITIGVLYALLAYRSQYLYSIEKLGSKIHQFVLLDINLSRLNEITAEPIEHQYRQEICKEPHLDFKLSGLEVKDLSFAYSDHQVFKNINFSIPHGECVVITGSSGCGKTTLLKILMGIMVPSAGELLVSNISIYPQHVNCYRGVISGVLQDDILLTGTIAGNISFFDRRVDMDKVKHCAALAGIIDEVMMLPMGFDTLIGDMGSVFSGGQRQRILLARALYAQPAFLFLDEATSHLDITKEREVNMNIRSLNMTTIMIAHRKETIDMADRVIQI